MTEQFEALKYFREICGIPHASGNTKEISAYCVNFAKKHSLRYIQDEYNNVVIYKKASPGYENHPGVIFQGHLDMVAEKSAESDHDFEKDGLTLCTENGFLSAKDTTLGADDGIAIAYALAILADDTLSHPAFEAVFTVDEEVGMLGADKFDASVLSGKYLLNCDSEEEGILTAGCAGGIRVDMSFPMEYTVRTAKKCLVTLDGFRGGHSGVEIHKNLANAHKVFGRLLFKLAQQVRFSVGGIRGGTKDNVIAMQVICELYVQEEDLPKLRETAALLNNDLLNEYAGSDENIRIFVEEGETKEAEMLSPNSLETLIFVLMNLPNGVCKMNASIPNLVETSLNCGVLQLLKDSLKVGCLIRSSVDSAKFALVDQLGYLCEMMGGEYACRGNYSGWQYQKNSRLREVFMESYHRLTGKDMTVTTIHAGLECGLFMGKKPELDCVSFGPNMYDIHTSRERLDLQSAYRTWLLILEVIKNL